MWSGVALQCAWRVRKTRPAIRIPRSRPQKHGRLPINPQRAAQGSGYVSIDALVALTLLASTLVFGISGADQGLRAARAGLEVRQANDLIQHLLEASRAGQGTSNGATPQFAWTLIIEAPVKSASAASLCMHTVTVRNLRTKRNYSAQTDEICPAGPE